MNAKISTHSDEPQLEIAGVPVRDGDVLRSRVAAPVLMLTLEHVDRLLRLLAEQRHELVGALRTRAAELLKIAES